MNIENLQMPPALKTGTKNFHIIALEGVDACGKTSLCETLANTYAEFNFVKIPAAYIEQPFKQYLYFKTAPMASALIFAASLVDRMNEIKNNSAECSVLDRSLWSTVALNWAKGRTNVAQDVLSFYEKISAYVPLPEKIYILDTPYEICRSRVMKRNIDVQKYDAMPYEEYRLHMEFYHWLEERSAGAKFLNTENLSLETLAKIIYNDIFSKRRKL